MSPANNEEQFKFLISCIRWSNSGKVDFGEVAKECSIVSKGAAAKRYERMMKAHGIAPNAATSKAKPAARNFKTERNETSAASKKRKADSFVNDRGAAEDDQEHFDNIKTDPGNGMEELQVKEEPNQMHMDNNQNLMPFLPHLGGEEQDYVSSSSMYEPTSNGFNTPVNHRNVYGPQDQSRFIGFATYGQSDTDGVENATSQTGQRQSESILIGD